MQVADLYATLGLKPDHHGFHEAHELIEKVKEGLEFFAGYEAIKWVGELVKGTGEAAIGALRMAQKIGTTTEAVQELGYAAKVSGVSAETLQHGFQHLALGLEEMRTKGSGPAADAFRQLGISFASVKNKTPDELLATLADKFAKLPDGAHKTALAMEIFGRAGAELIPMLNRGGEGIDELRKQAEELGIVMSKEDAKSFEELEESTAKIHGALTGLKNTAIKALLPVIQEMADSLFEWVKANREVIASTIKGVVEALIDAFKVLGAVIGVVVDVIQFFIEHATLGKSVLIALGAVITAVAAEAAAAWIIGFAPIAAVVAGITALLLIFKDLLDQIVTGKSVIGSVLGWIADKFKAMGRSILDAFKAVGSFFESIASAIKSAFVSVINWITDKIAWAWDQVKKIAHYVTHPQDIVTDIASAAGNAIFGSDEEAPATGALRAVAGAAGGGSVSIDAPMHVEINAANANAQDVKELIDDKIAEHHEKTWRDIHAATGGDEEPEQ